MKPNLFSAALAAQPGLEVVHTETGTAVVGLRPSECKGKPLRLEESQAKRAKVIKLVAKPLSDAITYYQQRDRNNVGDLHFCNNRSPP